ncbi:uncharacterized protein LOC133909059 [Phragmites australis]|uniref:uncharacterized protein LOC133909059 n=1 Tax=Phragmites australis TaxID=29695 RepID=UPI002D77AF6B|nr:uncharacterized protein LOC133909059 [Phragmites australis]
MDADEVAESSRRMDLNLYLGLPRAPRPRRSDLGSDLALSTPMPSSPSSSAASVDAPPPPEPLHPPYSPSRADLSPPPPEVYSPYYPEDPPAPDAHLPYVPPPGPLIPEFQHDLGLAFQAPPPLVRASELLGWEDRPSSSTASSSFFPDTTARYRRLLEQTGSRWLRTRRFRSDLPPLSSEARPTGQDAAVPVPQHESATDTAEVNKVTANGAELGALEERGKTVATFECNICFEMASEPVVTSCGHLFCWPCLYQWLNVYSNHKECPVCKGEVTDANITPIYGRGNSDGEKAVEDVKSPGPTIPPRPHGNRLESFRQQFHHMRPISRRLGEAHGLLSSWRRLLDQQIMNSVSRFEGPSESAVPEINDSAQHASRLSRLALATRMRARRLQREAENPPDGGSIGPDNDLLGNNASESSRRGSTPHVQDGLDLLERLAFIGIANTERLATAMSDLRRIASPSQYGGSALSSNPQNHESTADGTHVAGAPSADQASNSSTIAVIQGDAGISESAGEPSNAGSSRSLRRRGRNNTLGSLDVDGGGLQRNKRRRMN